jgi:hypothetical protein
MNRKQLIKIADYLDSVGRPEDADIIDEVLIDDDMSSKTIEVPEDEYEELRRVLDSLKESLD